MSRCIQAASATNESEHPRTKSFRRHSALGKLHIRRDVRVGRTSRLADELMRANPQRNTAGRVLHSITIHWEPLMSVFGKIMGAIFGHHAEAAPAGGGAPAAGGTAPAGSPAAAPT